MAQKNTMTQLGVDIEELKEKVQENGFSGEETAATDTAPETEAFEVPVAAPKIVKERSRKYKEARSQVDRTIAYSPDQAVSLLKRLSYSRFAGTVSAHLNLKRELKSVEVTFPHSTGKELRVAIATEELLEEITNGQINFDVLLAEPKMMPKLAKVARVLGPRGLMPNPKVGTVTTDPETKKKSLESGALTIRPEKKALLMHVRIGKTDQPEEELLANLDTLIRAVNVLNIDKLTIAATMSPGIKVHLS